MKRDGSVVDRVPEGRPTSLYIGANRGRGVSERHFSHGSSQKGSIRPG